MRALYLDVPVDLVISRRRFGLDKFDEMWEGELHMAPFPTWEHQGIDGDLLVFFKLHWERLGEGLVRQNVGVKAPGTPDVEVAAEKVPADYRGPDQAFVLRGHEDRIQNGWVVGPPDAVIEIRSPGDETYEKLPFYFRLGVPEVIIVHRDTKAVEIHRRGAAEYDRAVADPDGSIASEVLDTVFRAQRNPQGRPVLRVWRRHAPEREGTA